MMARSAFFAEVVSNTVSKADRRSAYVATPHGAMNLALYSALVCALIGVIGSTSVKGKIDQQQQVLFFVLPFAVVFFVLAALFKAMQAHLTVDTSENSERVGVREASRSSWINSGVVAALAFSTVVGMMQAGPVSYEDTLLQAWYLGLIYTAVGYTLIGIGVSSLALLYTDALDESVKL